MLYRLGHSGYDLDINGKVNLLQMPGLCMVYIVHEESAANRSRPEFSFLIQSELNPMLQSRLCEIQ